MTFDAARLGAALPSTGPTDPTEPFLPFARSPVFVERDTVRQMNDVVRAVHELVELPRFVEHSLLAAPPTARAAPNSWGILHGFDFHLSERGPQLIEINTNAGGALLNLALLESQTACCDGVSAPFAPTAETVEARLLQGFRNELLRSRPGAPELRTVAIVDEDPEAQFLHPEFLLFQDLFRQHGIEAHICDPRALERRSGALWLGSSRIDLVYNRLTDFYLTEIHNQPIAEALVAGEVAVTPNPRHHALFANKRHLALLSEPDRLQELGLSKSSTATLANHVPKAELVCREQEQSLFQRRKQLFFKPLTGYGSKAAYRGDKLTRGKFDAILQGEYLAQAIVPPSERTIDDGSAPHALKFDVRAYVVEREIVLLAARLYQGQTTNFRTPGGGFATVMGVPAVID